MMLLVDHLFSVFCKKGLRLKGCIPPRTCQRRDAATAQFSALGFSLLGDSACCTLFFRHAEAEWSKEERERKGSSRLRRKQVHSPSFFASRAYVTPHALATNAPTRVFHSGVRLYDLHVQPTADATATSRASTSVLTRASGNTTQRRGAPLSWRRKLTSCPGWDV